MLDREKVLFRDMFERRKSLAYRKEFALEVVDYKRERIQYLIDHGVIHENGDFLEMEDVYVQFFEDVLDVMTMKVISNKVRTLRYQYLPPCFPHGGMNTCNAFKWETDSNEGVK